MSDRRGRVADRAIVVTGAGSGIGRAAALLLGDEGANLVLVDGDAAARTADEAGDAVVVTADVRDEEQIARVADTALTTFGRIDGLYANAGVDGAGRAHELTRGSWDRVIDINLTGTWQSIRAVLPAMIERGGGTIVTQASTAALVGVSDLAAYSAAKGHVALTRQIAVDYGRDGIRANTLCPGTVWTPLVERTYHDRGGDTAFGSPQAMRDSAARGYPLGRLGTPDELATLAMFLLSDESSWISGGVFTADGGYTAR